MENDEDWQTGRKYMKMIEDEDSDTDLPVRACLCVYARRQVRTQTGEDLIKDINKIKQGVSAKEELVAC
jgi:hypothetical protein